MSFFRKCPVGIEIFIRLTPKSSRDMIEGVVQTDDGRSHVKARVRAVPEDGKANQALEKLIAKQFKLPRSNVSIVAGSTARLKTVEISGDFDALSALLTKKFLAA